MSTTLLPLAKTSALLPKLPNSEQAAMRLVWAVQALSLTRTLAEVVDIVRTSAREISRADGASFILRDGDQCHYVDEDAVSPLWKGQRFPMAACISGWTMINRQAAVIPDIYTDPRIPYEAYRPTFVRSLVMTPIRTEDPIGAIGIYWARNYRASELELELLQALANTTSLAVENVRLYLELEERVQERTRQLAEANRELETFSYSVSHDLQSPLRHIKAYVALLHSDELVSFNEAAREYLTRIDRSAGRMSDLINDLLRLARYATVEMKSGRVNLGEMASEIVDNLRKGAPARLVDFITREDIEVNGDKALLRIALENLIGNAWKFTSKQERAVIEFGTTTEPDGSVVYFVRDNGTGFDMQHAGKLFGAFQRLHTEDQFEGTGIGLATVQRIVRRHGGRIWAEAINGQGATFSFTLAQAELEPIKTGNA